MAKWRKKESLGHALGREAGSVAKGVGKELLSIATLGLFKRQKVGHGANYRNDKVTKIKH